MANYRLNESMESRIHREVYVRFGGELSKSRHSNMKMGVGSLAYVINTVGNIFSGQVVGETAKTLSERFGKVLQKIFHAEIVVDTDKVKREESHYQPIPIINDFKDADGNDCMKQAIQDNYNRIKEDVKQIVKDELERIAADENLKHLIQKA